MLATVNTLQFNLDRNTESQATNPTYHISAACIDSQTNTDLKNVVLEYNGSDFDPRLLFSTEFPTNLTSLSINVRGAIPQDKMANIRLIIHLGRKLRSLNDLKTLSIKLPTTSHTNMMIHNMPYTLVNLEELDLEFIEPENVDDCEEFYVNSCLEWTSGMKKLRRMRLKSTRLNYTYCSFMKPDDILLTSLTKLEWIDDLLTKGLHEKLEIRGNSWIECKKEDDFNLVFGVLVPEQTEYLELPLVFDGLSGRSALTKFLQFFERLNVLKELRLSLGFKLLEETDVIAVQEALKLIKSKKSIENVSLSVFYRDLSKDIPAGTFSLENRQKMLKDDGIAYIYYPKYD